MTPRISRKTLIGIGALTGLAACFGKVTEDNWGEKSAKAYCKFYKDCTTAYFFYYYDDLDDCVDEFVDDYEDAEDYYDDCDFDDDNAADCIDALGQSCKNAGEDLDDLYESCWEVWDCSDAGGWSTSWTSYYYYRSSADDGAARLQVEGLPNPTMFGTSWAGGIEQ